MQGAIPQDEKWQASNHDTTLNLYRHSPRGCSAHASLSGRSRRSPDTANDLVPYIKNLYAETHAHGSALVMGILRAEGADPDTRYYNSVLALDETVGWYDKSHLVPFAEFFPVPQFVRTWLRLMSLPYSDFTHGAANQPPLAAAGLQLGTTICYEDAYGSSMLRVLPRANALVNVTNDAWFGHSSARYQHLQILRMRALEARPLSGAGGERRHLGHHRPARRSHRPRSGIRARYCCVSEIIPHAGSDALCPCWQLAGSVSGERRAGVRSVGAE